MSARAWRYRKPGQYWLYVNCAPTRATPGHWPAVWFDGRRRDEGHITVTDRRVRSALLRRDRRKAKR